MSVVMRVMGHFCANRTDRERSSLVIPFHPKPNQGASVGFWLRFAGFDSF